MPVYRVAICLTGILRVPAASAEEAERAVVDGFPEWVGPGGEERVEIFDRELTAVSEGEVVNYDLFPDDSYQKVSAE